MKRKIYTILLALMCFTVGEAFAQGFTLSGQVTDASSGDALIGVNVAIPSLNRGSITDVNGRYSINLSPGTYNVVTTYVGYTRVTREVTITNANVTLDFQLEADVVGLDQVVVVGYGELSRREVTGAIASVRGEEIQFAPVNTIENAIQGRLAGVFIQQNNGKLGQGIQIRVRGASSVSASNQPLYVIDGVPVVMDDFSLSSAQTNPLSQFNFNDVESIQVLKDASAAAIYGSRAANGVVLITTKSGRSGRTNFNYTYQFGTSEPTNKVAMLNAKEYVEYSRQAAANTDAYLGTGTIYQDFWDGELDWHAQGTNWRGCLNSLAECAVNTNWQDEAFQDAGMFSHDISASGGNDRTTFFVSGHFSDQAGILIKDNFERISTRVKIDHKANDRISMGMNVSAGRSFHTRVSNDNAFSTPMQLIALPPISPIFAPQQSALPNYVPTDEYNNNTVYANGLLHAANSKYNVTTFRSTGTAYLAYQLMPGLSFRTEGSADLMIGNDDQWYSQKTARTISAAALGGYGSSAWQMSASYNTNNYFNYQRNVMEGHNLTADFGMSYQYNDYLYTYTDAQGFPNDSFQRLTSAATPLDASSTGSEYSFLSYFLRTNYNIDDKYLVSLSGRVDGSSRFGSDNRYGFFPAGSVGWVITEESFAEGMLRYVPYLKLRASYGITGNAGIGNFGSLGLWGGTAYGGNSGINPTQIPNPNLSWETTRQLDLGFDFGLFNNRITGEFDYYVKKTEDLLLNVQIPATSGFSTSLRNVGNMENKGWEVVLNSFNINSGEFRWTTNFNISMNKNEVTNLDGQVLSGGILNRAIEGYAIGVFYGREFAGVDPANGNALFNIYSDDDCKVFDRTTTSYNSASECVLGNPNPTFTGGLGNTFTYKGFELNVLFQFVQDIDLYIGGSGRWSRGSGIYEDNSFADQLDAWSPTNTNTNIPQNRLYVSNGNQNSSRYVVDGSYIRLKNLTFGYALPQNLLAGTGLTKMRLYMTGVNLLTFTDYPGWDPEMNTDYLAGNIGLGNEFYTAPQARTITFGVDIGF